MNFRLLLLTFLTIASAMLCWQWVFHHHAIVKPLLPEIHLTFISINVLFFLISYALNEFGLTVFKAAGRIIFKVWLIVFITFTISNPMRRIGFILPITFIFSYFEGLIEIEELIKRRQVKSLPKWLGTRYNKVSKCLLSTMILSGIHALSTLILWIFLRAQLN